MHPRQPHDLDDEDGRTPTEARGCSEGFSNTKKTPGANTCMSSSMTVAMWKKKTKTEKIKINKNNNKQKKTKQKKMKKTATGKEPIPY